MVAYVNFYEGALIFGLGILLAGVFLVALSAYVAWRGGPKS